MLERDECNRLLVTNSFADGTESLSSLVSPTLDPLFECPPLRTRSVSPASRYSAHNIPSIAAIGSEGETQPRLTCPLGLDILSIDVTPEEEEAAASEAPEGGNEIIVHSVVANDSLASVALRYRVSIAAIRRANQLWPSDPIHLRTQLLIPRGDYLPVRNRPTDGGSTDVRPRSPVQPTPSVSSDIIASSLVAARNMILSFPARISLESLSSKATASEDHELDDLRTARARKVSTAKISFNEEGYELSTLAVPYERYRRPDFPLSSHFPFLPSNNQHLDSGLVSPTGDLHSPSMSSPPAVSLERLHRTQPFIVRPVRTSQLEPEPAMELPVRRSRIRQPSLIDDSHPNL